MKPDPDPFFFVKGWIQIRVFLDSRSLFFSRVGSGSDPRHNALYQYVYLNQYIYCSMYILSEEKLPFQKYQRGFLRGFTSSTFQNVNCEDTIANKRQFWELRFQNVEVVCGIIISDIKPLKVLIINITCALIILFSYLCKEIYHLKTSELNQMRK